MKNSNLKKDFYKQDYLDINNNSSSAVTAIIPTYNRCPFSKNSKKFKYNPLYVCLETLSLQSEKPNEVIIIDDNSKDNIKQVIELFSKKLNIIYKKNKTNKGSAISRNIASKLAKNNYLLFLDDDCVIPLSTISISIKTFKELESKKDLAALVLPVYNHKTYPDKFQKITTFKNRVSDIGKKNPNFSSFPLEYLDKPKFINKKQKILEPIKTSQTWGYFLCKKQDYLSVNGFPEDFDWPNHAGEEIEFAERILEKDKQIYYLPDPKVACVHGSFGKKGEPFSGEDWLSKISDISLKEFIKICNSFKYNSGNRVSDKDFFFSKIISLFILKSRKLDSLKQMLEHSYQNWINTNKKLDFLQDKLSIKVKQDIYFNAIEKGLKKLRANRKEIRSFLKSKFPNRFNNI